MKIGMRIDSVNSYLMFDNMYHLRKFIEKFYSYVEKEFEDKPIKISCNEKWTNYETFYDCIQENWESLVANNALAIHFGYTEWIGEVDTTFNTLELLQIFLITNENKSIKANCEKFYRIDD